MKNEIMAESAEINVPEAICEERSAEDFEKVDSDDSLEDKKPSETPACDDDTDDTKEEKELSAEEMIRELKALKEELSEKRRVLEKMSRDIGEFEEIFPDKRVNEIPDSVWESVREGIPLAAAYALYERKNAIRKDSAASTNVKNSSRATGPIGRDVTETFYTPDEVRAMSRTEVKKNYSKILESMKKWN